MSVDKEFLDQIGKYLADVRERSKDGISVSDLTQSAIGCMRLAMSLLDRLPMPGPERKAEVLKVVEYFFDSFADACIPLVAKPVWWIVRPAVRALILSLASGAIEGMLPIVRAAK